MTRDAILVLDIGGRIVWANRSAHDNVSLPPGALLGRNYLEFCPPDTHAELLRLHKKKIDGESVRFRFDLGRGRVMTVTSGPVRIEDRLYLYVVGRKAVGPPAGDEMTIGMIAAAEALDEKRRRLDLNALLMGAMKDEARTLKGRLVFDPGATGMVLVRPWPVRMMLRRLLLQTLPASDRARVATGGDRKNSWVRIDLPKGARPESRDFAACRRIATESGGRLQVRGQVVRLILPCA